MYVKVHKKGNQWFRNDNGTLVGTEIPENTSYYKTLSKRIGKHIIIKNTSNEIKLVYYGYFYNNKFTRSSISCLAKNCDYYAFVPG